MNNDPLQQLPAFLAYSLMLEQESAERLWEFADMMRQHNQHALAALFSELATFSDEHAEQVKAICGGHELPELKPWEFEWAGPEPPETGPYERVQYQMSPRAALLQMLEQERTAAEFYTDIVQRSKNAEIKCYASEFADEEDEHVRRLESWLQTMDLDVAQMVPSAPDIDPPHQPA